MRIFTLLLCFATALLSAQTEQDIKSNKNYLWGEGTGRTIKKADNNALQDLIQQISTQVQSDFETKIIENNDNISEFTSNAVKSASSATLTGADRIILQDEPEAKVLRYIPKKKIATIFEGRKHKIISFAQKGEDFIQNQQLGFGLKYTYWALVLLITHPDQDLIMAKEAFADTSGNLKSYLMQTMDKLFSTIDISPIKVKKEKHQKQVYLQVAMNSKPVNHLDIKFWDGNDWSNTHTIRNGNILLSLYKSLKTDKLKMKINYTYAKESAIDKELHNSMTYMEDYLPYFREAHRSIPLDEIALPKNLNKPQTSIAKVINGIESGKKPSTKTFSTNGIKAYKNIIGYGNAKILPTKEVTEYKLLGKTIHRSVPMNFSFNNNYKTFSENVVFATDTTSHKVEDIQFALDNKTYEDIMFKGSKWPFEEKQLVVDFIEKYKTAYAMENVKFLEQVFSQDALILVGQTLKKNKHNEFGEKTAYTKLTKADYINRLKILFDTKEYVNITFEGAEVRMSKYKGVYGVNLKQFYTSSNYSDMGYLFLVIDLRKINTPQIHVRTWQSEEHLKERGLYGLTDFF